MLNLYKYSRLQSTISPVAEWYAYLELWHNNVTAIPDLTEQATALVAVLEKRYRAVQHLDYTLAAIGPLLPDRPALPARTPQGLLGPLVADVPIRTPKEGSTEPKADRTAWFEIFQKTINPAYPTPPQLWTSLTKDQNGQKKPTTPPAVKVVNGHTFFTRTQVGPLASEAVGARLNRRVVDQRQSKTAPMYINQATVGVLD